MTPSHSPKQPDSSYLTEAAPQVHTSLTDEDARECSMFDRGTQLHDGDVRLNMAHMLRIWACVHPGGSYAAQCHIMANEIVKLSAAAPSATAPDPTPEMLALRDLLLLLADIIDPPALYVSAEVRAEAAVAMRAAARAVAAPTTPKEKQG